MGSGCDFGRIFEDFLRFPRFSGNRFACVCVYTCDMEVTLANPVDPAQLSNDVSVRKAVIAQLLESLGSLRRQKEQLEYRLQQLLRARFGQKAEKIDPAQMALFAQQILTELQKTEPLPQEPAGEPPAPRPGHGREKLPRLSSA